MTTINTSENGWQDDLGECMQEGKNFELVTPEEELAKALEDGDFSPGLLRYFLLGTGVGFAGGYSTARLSGATGTLSAIDPEPISKAILAGVAIVSAAVGGYCIYQIVKTLVDGTYNFRISHQNSAGEWVVEATKA